MPNSFAYFMLFAWLIVGAILFHKQKIPAALAWTVIAGYLFLPTRAEIDLPILPPFNKTLVPSLIAGIMCFIFTNKQRAIKVTSHSSLRAGSPLGISVTALKGFIPRSRIGFLLVISLVLSAVITGILNNDRIVIGGRALHGLTYYDALSFGLAAAVLLLPFLLGRKFLASPKDHLILLYVLSLAGFIYTFFALFEIRMSPQLNTWIYGFFPHSFAQHYRGGGFRPVVFLEHGLWLGIFLAASFLATLGLWRSKKGNDRGLLLFVAIWVAMTFVLSKNFGALLITVVLAPLILLFKVRIQMIAAAIIATTILFYPIVRGANVLPLDNIISTVKQVSEERAGSLKYRFDNEDILLDRANERPLFGWAGWGRSRVYDEYSGSDTSTTDGAWIIILGIGGWARYFTEFGLLTIPILLLALRAKKLKITIATSALCLILCANLVDLIPNATLTPVTWLIAGALMGRLEVGTTEEAVDTEITEPALGGVKYRRALRPKVKVATKDKTSGRRRRI
jgi:hypothetical protein